jgi:hypothetical protein
VCPLALKDNLGGLCGGSLSEIPKEILNAIDSFNVESNEEFLGFE